MASSATGPQSWAGFGDAAVLSVVARLAAGLGMAFPNRSRPGPVTVRTGSASMGSRAGTPAMTASSSAAAFSARACASTAMPGASLRSRTVSLVSKPVPRRA